MDKIVLNENILIIIKMKTLIPKLTPASPHTSFLQTAYPLQPHLGGRNPLSSSCTACDAQHVMHNVIAMETLHYS